MGVVRGGCDDPIERAAAPRDKGNYQTSSMAGQRHLRISASALRPPPSRLMMSLPAGGE